MSLGRDNDCLGLVVLLGPARELLASAGWRARSINCGRLIDFLLIEHMNHGGRENGELMATYDQLEAFGIGRRLVHAAMSEAERLGLISVERGGRRGFALNHASRLRLTWLPGKERDAFGRIVWVSATNEWRSLKTIDARRKRGGTNPEHDSLSCCTRVARNFQQRARSHRNPRISPSRGRNTCNTPLRRRAALKSPIPLTKGWLGD